MPQHHYKIPGVKEPSVADLYAFIESPLTKKLHVSCKRRSFCAALADFKKLYRPAAYYCIDTKSSRYKDDSFVVHYRPQAGDPA